MIKKLYQLTKKMMINSKDYVVHSDIVLPAPDKRFCGPEFKDNTYYLQSAKAEAKRLIRYFDCNKTTKVLDVGCGQGRLPIGILKIIGNIDYIGIDVDRNSIIWCKKHIQNHHPSFKFYHLDVANERYNKNGTKLNKDFKLDLSDNSIDIIYLFSVFSHMYEDDMRIYLSDFRRILKSNGKVFFTTFVEENVPNNSINPNDYILKKCSGALHIVRYEKNYLFAMLNELGFIVKYFAHRTETDYQSALYLSKK